MARKLPNEIIRRIASKVLNPLVINKDFREEYPVL